MAIIRCENKHYYDDNNHDSCPMCAKAAIETEDTDFSDRLRRQDTIYKDVTADSESEQLTEAYGAMVNETDKTISIYTDETGSNHCVGWLVCVNGPVKGKSYTLHSGRNFAGRSLEMDIVLSDDLKISREKHFSIIYDPKSIAYYLIPESGSTLLNDTPITTEMNLKEGDTIHAGDSDYAFVPFCKEGRTW